MLIEFRVANFRSIREEQTLSMVAGKDSSLADTHLTHTGIQSIPNLIRSAVIYGPNAGGKSNLIDALAFMQNVVVSSATQMVEGQSFNCQPFKLDEESAKSPIEFELTFLLEGIRHQYGFALTRERVVKEWLLVYKAAKAQQWFSRRFDTTSGKDIYDFSTYFTGQRKLWEETTRSNALFLSTVDLNSELLRPIFLWITQKLFLIAAGMQPIFDFTITMAKNDEGKGAVLRFLAAAAEHRRSCLGDAKGTGGWGPFGGREGTCPDNYGGRETVNCPSSTSLTPERRVWNYMRNRWGRDACSPLLGLSLTYSVKEGAASMNWTEVSTRSWFDSSCGPFAGASKWKGAEVHLHRFLATPRCWTRICSGGTKYGSSKRIALRPHGCTR